VELYLHSHIHHHDMMLR